MQCKVLQFKLNRLYFDIGEESLVFAGHRAVVTKKKDTLWAGVIDKAYDGVSVSEPLDKPFDLKSINAYVQAAEVDSHAVIRIGTTIGEPVLKMILPAKLDSIAVTTRGIIDSLTIRHYEDAQALEIDFQSGALDGVLTYRPSDIEEAGAIIQSAWAPYMAAIAPYWKSVYRGFAVTQPLFRQFDTGIARGLFEGSELRYESTLVTGGYSNCPEFNPARGRYMLRPIVEHGLPVRIFAPDRELHKMAGYFADLLAREQVKSDLVSTVQGCDFSLKMIPAGQYPDSTLKALLELLGPGDIPDEEASSNITNLRNALQYLRDRSDSLGMSLSWPEVEIILVGKLSCYPLFRPKLYFVSHRSIRGSIFSPDGTLDPTGLMRVQSIGGGKER